MDISSWFQLWLLTWLLVPDSGPDPWFESVSLSPALPTRPDSPQPRLQQFEQSTKHKARDHLSNMDPIQASLTLAELVGVCRHRCLPCRWHCQLPPFWSPRNGRSRCHKNVMVIMANSEGSLTSDNSCSCYVPTQSLLTSPRMGLL